MPIIKRIASEEYADKKALYEANKAVENVPQSDWNQNDETAVDFIKNRTHYEKNETVEHTYSFNFDNDKDSYEYSNTTYKFYKLSNETQQINTTNITAYFDYKGVEYTANVEMTKKGNYYRVGILKANSVMAYQFVIVYKEGGATISGKQLSIGIWLIMPTGTYKNAYSSYARIIESYSATTIKPLDEKFIPDTIARKEYVNEAKEYVLLNDCENGYEYIVRMANGSIISVCRCSEISIDTMPDKTEYVEGESLDLTGLVVIATRQDGSTFVVTNYDAPTELPSDGIISISYTEAGVTYTVSFNITISPVDSGEENESPE